ncbi:hypothetical protein O4H49_07675 [Kiloniella laminariae]|uniref:DUF7336 domain-containing protein n=1 Tax=Kiloniella laminariae TaxID=454162 RepID=A0ABT4LHS1_9PROT|nr:hypothetical protein [Kiloniella laminariae]MCZ4280653.1 hypothetical protein [Kiloniella laminariae]
MRKVYILEHVQEFDEYREIVKTLGVFENEEKARKAIAKLKSMPEFTGSEDGFSISCTIVDNTGWLEGYGEG